MLHETRSGHQDWLKMGFAYSIAGLVMVSPAGAAGNCPPIDGDGKDNVLVGTNCGEIIRGHGGNDTIHGRGGNDNVNGGLGDDEIFGEQGDDILNGWSGADLLDGGPGNDQLKGFGGNDILYGQDGDDQLEGESDDDHLDGGPGTDMLLGGSGDDYLDDADGANTLDGMSNRDTVVGRTGAGILRGGRQDDFIIIVGNSINGYETIEGDVNQRGGGSDLLFFARDANPEMVSLHPATGHLQLSFDLRIQESVAIDLADVIEIEAVATGDGDDTLIGTDRTNPHSYANRLGGLFVHELFFSGAGDDVIETGEGSDYVDAGDGNDTLRLGSGECYLIGGEGSDTFVWSTKALSGNRVSRITDMAPGDTVQWQGDWTPDDVSLEATEIDSQPATSVKLQGVPKLTLEGIEPEAVRIRQARQAVWLDVLRSLPQHRSAPSMKMPFLSEGR